MRIIRVATLALLSACAQASTVPAPDPASAVAFEAVGRNVRGEVIERLTGTAYVYPNEVRVVLRSGVAGLSTTQTRQQPALFAGLAYGDTTHGWNIRRQSRSVPASRMRLRGDTLADPVVFRIPDTRGIDLEQHWVVIQQERVLRFDDGWSATTRPLHGPLDMFRRGPSGS